MKIIQARVDEIKGKWEMLFRKKKWKELSYEPEFGGMNTAKRVRNISLTLRRETTLKKHRKFLNSGSLNTGPFCILSKQKLFYNNLYKTQTKDNAENGTESGLTKSPISEFLMRDLVFIFSILSHCYCCHINFQ